MLAIAIGIGALCCVIERLWPGWQLPRVQTWALRVIAINLVQLAVVLVAGVTWERWLAGPSRVHLSQPHPPWAGARLAYGLA
ncbi:MAG: sterol desaturase family protein, partial [Betaproteobacteria bacterium]